jgi:signal peptidase
MTRTAARRLARRAARVLVAVPLAGLGLALASVSFPHLFGASTLIVRSGSMGRAAPIGSIVVTRTIPATDVRVGTIVAVRPAGASGAVLPTVHRVVQLQPSPEGIVATTKGDANPVADPQPHVLTGPVRVVWFHLPLLGYLVASAQTRAGWVLLIILPATILCTLFLVDLWRPRLEMADNDDRADDSDNDSDNERARLQDDENENLRRQVADLQDDVARLQFAIALARRHECIADESLRFRSAAREGSDVDELRARLSVVTEERDALLEDDRERPAYWRALMRRVVQSSEGPL